MRSLCEALRGLELKTYSGQTIIPHNLLNQTLTAGAINDLLSGNEFQRAFYKRDELTQLLLNGGKKTIAVLLLIQRPISILKFLERDMLQDLDSRLPLTVDELGQILEDDRDAEEFYQTQWSVLAPILQKNRSHRIFEENTPLPYVKSEPVAKGGYGNIFKVTILPAHQQLVNVDPDGNVCIHLWLNSDFRIMARRENGGELDIEAGLTL